MAERPALGAGEAIRSGRTAGRLEGKRAGVFGRHDRPEFAAVADGLVALGARLTWQRPSVWEDRQALDFDLVVTHGQQLGSGRAARLYRERGVPVLTVDLPALRLEGYFALWRGYVNTVPQRPRPPDRLRAMGFAFSPWRRDGSGVLLCGQKDGDQSHGMDAQSLATYFKGRCAELRAAGRRVTWRPHPEFRFQLGMADGFSDPSEPFEAVVGRYEQVATINSTCGLKALAAGVPVLTEPSCFYSSLCSTEAAAAPYYPSLTALESFYSRLAYTQWTIAEFSSGEALRETLED